MVRQCGRLIQRTSEAVHCWKHDMKTRHWAKNLISVIWNISGKSEPREIFSLNFRDQVDFIKNVQSNRKRVEKIFGIDRGTKIHRKGRNQTNGPRSSSWLDVYVFRTWRQALDSVCVKGSTRFCSTCNLYMQEDMWSTRWIGQARGVTMHATKPWGQTCGGRGVSLHGARPCIQTGRGCGVTLHVRRPCWKTSGAQGAAAHASGAMRSDTRLVSD